MITDQKIKNLLYDAIRGSVLHHAVSGKVYKVERAIDSEKEDIVISVSANRGGQEQTAYANVNVYVKDLYVAGQWVENTKRTEALADICADMFDVLGGSGNKFRATLENQQTFANRDTNEHFINNRIFLRFINI